METRELIQLKGLLHSFINQYTAQYPISAEDAQGLPGTIDEILEGQCLQECTSCEKNFDIETMEEDSDSNYFCGECYKELAPVMKAEYDELVERGEIEQEEENEEWIHVPDIRNKLSPVCHLITMVDMGRFASAKVVLQQSKVAVNYLSKRSVYSIPSKIV